MSLSKTLSPLFSLGSIQEDSSGHDRNFFDWNIKNKKNSKNNDQTDYCKFVNFPKSLIFAKLCICQVL